MNQIYCDNGSTSFPKAPDLGKTMGRHIENRGFNISRGGYSQSYSLESEVIETREAICQMFNGENPKNVIFTPGATWGLNMLLQGLLKKGDHVITTAMEHNAVVRPIAFLQDRGVEWSVASVDSQGNLNVENLKSLIRENTKLILITHGSNVSGTITPITEIGKISREKNIFFAVDGAQTAGSEKIDMKESNIDALIFAGHKALLGPQGIGGIVLGTNLVSEITPIILGGTGSLSDKEYMPEFMPDKLQPGTMNIPGVIGLKHSLRFLQKETIDGIKEKKKELTSSFLEKVFNIKGISIIGRKDTKSRTSVISLDFSKVADNAEIAFILERDYGILTRCGMHCAPMAHKSFNTYPEGTLRFSFGYFNTSNEIASVADAINKTLKEI